MTPARTVTAERLRDRARRWLAEELERARRAHRSRWPEHETWVHEYLMVELHERLSRYARRPHGRAR